MLRYVCKNILYTTKHSDDILQNVFIKAFESYEDLETKKAFKNWICQITKNECFQLYNKMKKSRKKIKYLEEIYHNDTHKCIENLEISLIVKSALRDLNDIYTNVIRLYYFDNYTYKEIANELGLNINTVKTRLRRAKLKLKENLEKDLC